jgi:hypothetical protein
MTRRQYKILKRHDSPSATIAQGEPSSGFMLTSIQGCFQKVFVSDEV